MSVVADEDDVRLEEDVEPDENAEVAEADVGSKDVTSRDDGISQDGLQSTIES